MKYIKCNDANKEMQIKNFMSLRRKDKNNYKITKIKTKSNQLDYKKLKQNDLL